MLFWTQKKMTQNVFQKFLHFCVDEWFPKCLWMSKRVLTKSLKYIQIIDKGLFTPSECDSESEKDQRTSKKDKRIYDKHQRKFSRSLSLGVNGPLVYVRVWQVLLYCIMHTRGSQGREKTNKHNYRPQTKFAKVMFLQVSVCPRGGRVWLLRGAGCAWLVRGGVCMVAPGGGACVGYDEIRRYGQWAGGTHPTGMHSCFLIALLSAQCRHTALSLRSLVLTCWVCLMKRNSSKIIHHVSGAILKMSPNQREGYQMKWRINRSYTSFYVQERKRFCRKINKAKCGQKIWPLKLKAPIRGRQLKIFE